MARRWLVWLVALAFVWIVVTRLAQLEELLEALRRAQVRWALAAAALQVLYYGATAFLYRLSFLAVGAAGRTRDLLAVLCASIFVNTLAPSGGLAGAALFVNDAARRGQSPARAAAGVLVSRIADSVGFAVLLVAGLLYLWRQRDLQPFQLFGAGVLVLLTAVLTALLLLGMSWPDTVGRMLERVLRVVNRAAASVRRPPPLGDDWAAQHAAEFAQASGAIAERPRSLLTTVGAAFGAHVIDLASLLAIFLAFNQPARFGVLVAVYTMGILFWKMSPVPEGVGVVEGVMMLSATSLGIPAAKAAVISLTFRGLTYWIPMAAGFLMVRRLQVFRSGAAAPRPDTPPISARP
jgi:hypothetical protein